LLLFFFNCFGRNGSLFPDHRELCLIGLALGGGTLVDADRQLCTQPCAGIRRSILLEAQMLYLADPVGRRAGVAQW
jgi:hypothetical protein